MKLKMLSRSLKKGLMKEMIDSKVLKVMDLAIKYIGELTESDLDKLISRSSDFSIVRKNEGIEVKGKKVKSTKGTKDKRDWNIEIEMIKKSKDREQASDYLRKLKLTNEGLRNLGQALGISISKSTKKDKIIAMIVDFGVGSRLKSEGIRKGIIG